MPVKKATALVYLYNLVLDALKNFGPVALALMLLEPAAGERLCW